jgi:hypothetical protein
MNALMPTREGPIAYLRHCTKLSLHVPKAAEGQHAVLGLEQVSHWHTEVL